MYSDRLTNNSASGKESGSASIATLVCAALAAIDTDRSSARAYLERAGALLDHIEFRHEGPAAGQFAKRPTLMAWQAKRVEEHVIAHLFRERGGVDDHGIDTAGLGNKRRDWTVFCGERAIDRVAGCGRAG